MNAHHIIIFRFITHKHTQTFIRIDMELVVLVLH